MKKIFHPFKWEKYEYFSFQENATKAAQNEIEERKLFSKNNK